jgi:hypothetical protein
MREARRKAVCAFCEPAAPSSKRPTSIGFIVAPRPQMRAGPFTESMRNARGFHGEGHESTTTDADSDSPFLEVIAHAGPTRAGRRARAPLSSTASDGASRQAWFHARRSATIVTLLIVMLFVVMVQDPKELKTSEVHLTCAQVIGAALALILSLSIIPAQRAAGSFFASGPEALRSRAGTLGSAARQRQHGRR